MHWSGVALINLVAGLAIGIAMHFIWAYDVKNICAKTNYVYECKLIAVPTREPNVIIKEAEILPPPVSTVSK